MAFKRFRTAGLMLLLFMPMISDANEIRILPFVSIEESLNDNLFFDSNNEKHDFITTISPGLKYDNNTETTQSNLAATFRQRIYAQNPDLNALDQTYRAQYQTLFNPRFRIGADAAFIRDASPDRDIETTGLVLNAVERDRYQANLNTAYAISEKALTNLSYGYSKDQYEETAEEDYNNLESNSGNMLVSYDISAIVPATKARSTLGYAHYQFPDIVVENYMATAGFSRDMSELWRVLVDAGARYTCSEFDVSEFQFVPPFSFVPVTRTENTTGWGAVGNASLTYQDDRITAELAVAQDIQPASGRSGTTERTTFSVRVAKKLTYELQCFVRSGFFINYSDSEEYSADEIDERTFYLSPGLTYNVSPDVAIDASYNYTRTDYESSSQATRNLFMIRLYVQYPILE